MSFLGAACVGNRLLELFRGFLILIKVELCVSYKSLKNVILYKIIQNIYLPSANNKMKVIQKLLGLIRFYTIEFTN